MGLIYSSSDSAKLIQGLKANIQSGKETVEQLKSGSQKIVNSVDGKTLSGAAYTAGKGLFSDCVIPTINRTTSAFNKIEQELSKYQTADAEISGEGYLDEDNLRRQIAAKQAMKTSVEASAAVARTLARSNPVASVLSSLLNVQNNLRNMSNSLESDIQKLKKKLDKLGTFSSKTSGLFSNSSSDLKLAMQGVLVLNSTTVNADGTYSFPNGIDNSWFSSIKGKKGSKNYDVEKAIKDFLEGTTPSEFSKEALSGLLSEIQKKVIIEKKNIGKSWAGKLQPRSSLGTFVKDEFKPRKWVTSNLRRIPDSVSNVVGKGAKWGGRALFALGAWQNAKDYYNEYHDIGRSISYSGVATVAGYVGGSVGAAFGTSLAVAAGATATGFIATVAAPVAGAVVVGAAVAVGVKALYNHSKGFKNAVDTAGDGLNWAGKKVKEGIGNVGKSLSNSVQSLTKVFS